MVDMIVRLYALPDSADIYAKCEQSGVILRRPGVYETHLVADFVRAHFSPKWVSEVQAAMTKQPAGCFIATKDKKILGFACYDTTCKGYFGPTGVSEEARGLGIGKALLFKSMEALRDQGYAYGIIGGVGPIPFYENAIGARVIEGSENSIYQDILPEPEA